MRELDALADLIEAHFYAAVPPEQRPKASFEKPDSTAEGSSTDDGSSENEKATPTKEILGARSGLAVKQDPEGELGKKRKYSKRPLLSAIHRAFFWRWWMAGAMKLGAGE